MITDATPAMGHACHQNSSILGLSPAIIDLRRQLPRVAAAGRTTLIVGPTGSGKELVARELHARSPRSAAPFIAVNCGALPDSLVESELFGHSRGAFTGANDIRVGLVPSAAGGTLFLDEINSLTLSAQSALLRFLENGEFRPVGSDRVMKSNSWVIAAATQDLHHGVDSGSFRRDLLYRLEVIRIKVPALAMRGDDILLLAEHFLEETDHAHGFSAGARQALLKHSWPGNIRELKHRVLNAAVLGEGPCIEAEDLGLAEGQVLPLSAAVGLSNELWGLIESGMTLGQAIEHCERQLIIGALRAEENNRTRAASRLGIHVRTIFKKLAGETSSETSWG
jgi:DNA-binding NtrC family response regulator